MKVAIVLHCDVHADPEVFAFANPIDALTFAEARLKEFDRFGDGKPGALNNATRRQGWLFFGTYGEGNSIRVEVKEVA